MKNRTLVATTALTVATFFGQLTPTHAAERVEHKELAAKSGGTLSFKTIVGAVEIKTQDRENVVYDASVASSRNDEDAKELLEALQFDYTEANGDVTITMSWKDGQAPQRVSLKAQHTLIIPTHYNIAVRTAAGSIKGAGIGGKVTAQTAAGDITLGKVDGDLQAHTSGGNVTLDGVKGDVDIKTAGGNIQVGEFQGGLMGKTAGGSITANLTKSSDKPLDLSTAGGNIKLAVPGDFKADLTARTAGGNVNCDLPIDGDVKKNSVYGKINGGGKRVSLKTSGGNIKVASN